MPLRPILLIPSMRPKTRFLPKIKQTISLGEIDDINPNHPSKVFRIPDSKVKPL